MKKVSVFLAAAVLVGSVSAEELYLFWSTTGISDPNLRYSTALTDFQPAYQAPTPLGWMIPTGTYDLFLWGAFPDGWENYQIYGLDLKWGPGNTAQHAQNVVYRHQWGSQPSQKRWDGTAGIPLDGFMSATTTSGIVWDTNTPAYRLMEPNGLFLIGAAHITGANFEVATISLDSSPSGQGIHVRDANGNEVSPTPDVIPAAVTFYTPEPATMLLVCCAVMIRRR